MSNRAHLAWTMFQDINGDQTWGWRLSDDYFSSFNDGCNEHDVPTDPMELLVKVAREAQEEESVLFKVLRTEEKGMYINGSWYEFEEIGRFLEQSMDQEE